MVLDALVANSTRLDATDDQLEWQSRRELPVRRLRKTHRIIRFGIDEPSLRRPVFHRIDLFGAYTIPIAAVSVAYGVASMESGRMRARTGFRQAMHCYDDRQENPQDQTLRANAGRTVRILR